MVLRLNQAGITTLEALAETDAAALRESLGSISRLLNVETWIAFARQQRQQG
jgi:predicted RecB family nuclease